MRWVSLNIIFIFVIYSCEASVDEDVNSYFQSQDRRLLQSIWRKYKKGFETSLEQLLQDDYDRKGINVFIRRTKDMFRLTEGFLQVADSVVEVVFRDLYLLELPRMRSPKVSLALGSNVVKVESDLLNIKVVAKYMVYRNDSVIVFARDAEMLKVSPFSLEQVHNTGEVTIIGEDCRLSGHAIATLSDQSVNLGHSTFSISDCNFNLEIWTPGIGSPPVFARYFDDCDRNFLQNIISKPLQAELMAKLQGGLFSTVNTSDVFGKELDRIRVHQSETVKSVHNHMTDVVNNLNALITSRNQGVENLDSKKIVWDELIKGHTVKKFVSIKDIRIYGLDTAYSGHSGGPIELNGTDYVEETIGFNTLQVKGTLDYRYNTPQDPELKELVNSFSAEIQDLSVVIRLNVENGLEAVSLSSSRMDKRSWYSPQMRNFELNLYDIDSIWARSLVTAHITNEIYTAVIASILTGQLNEAQKQSASGKTGNKSRGIISKLSKTEGKNLNKGIKKLQVKIFDEDEELPKERNLNAEEESMVLWQNKKSENVSLTVGKDEVRVEVGNRTMFKTSRLDNEINTE